MPCGQRRRADRAARRRRSRAGAPRTPELVCSWARTRRRRASLAEPVAGAPARTREYTRGAAITRRWPPAVHRPQLEAIEDVPGVPVNTSRAGRRRRQAAGAAGGMRIPRLRRNAPRRRASRDAGARASIRASAACCCTRRSSWCGSSSSDFHVSTAPTTQVLRPTIRRVGGRPRWCTCIAAIVPVELRPAVEREKPRLERLIEALLEARKHARAVHHRDSSKPAARSTSPAASSKCASIASMPSKAAATPSSTTSPASRARCAGTARRVRDPQLLAYLMAERGRNVQALANVSLTRGRARFIGKARARACCPASADCRA